MFHQSEALLSSPSTSTVWTTLNHYDTEHHPYKAEPPTTVVLHLYLGTGYGNYHHSSFTYSQTSNSGVPPCLIGTFYPYEKQVVHQPFIVFISMEKRHMKQTTQDWLLKYSCFLMTYHLPSTIVIINHSLVPSPS